MTPPSVSTLAGLRSVALRAGKLAATANLIPAPSQQPGLYAGFPQTSASQPIVSASCYLSPRCLAAQRKRGLARALYQHKRGLAGIGRKRQGWTVNPSAYAHTGSNPVPATTGLVQKAPKGRGVD